ncbi:amino acid ABC transporter ATP-binding protein [Alkalibacter saccharofermentans]|uniref:Amino acid ABC transporter ATP-binding protein, PAAT family (TC 3.A.1.3.-) n=1 Tax=Alkalibacter saccharofermentans DSM 14828 TaxID=1120975 RepID=A0A1M4WMD5_9FIRM|nr:ATP-binding cassette domain-containing protein [Alkalibacter saccharofermentans]SHE82223.1 amino acid ABC transporter ATP-binding protein, PAAT family (TC 3.A.1.3.-) [Alkalibacter saccharofermentans DSM 14828]
MLRVNKLSKSFGDKKVLDQISFEVEKGDIAIITGPSGVGKTTLIRCLSSLETYDSGTIDISERRSEKEHPVGLVFQSFNLFPHLSSLENITFPLIKAKGMNKEDAKKKALELMESLGLTGLEGSYPFQLSGGQKQRVAIARALAMDPEYLCFDEPTSALDSKLRDSVGEILREIAKKGTGVIVITHDREFAEKYSTKLYALGSELERVE